MEAGRPDDRDERVARSVCCHRTISFRVLSAEIIDEVRLRLEHFFDSDLFIGDIGRFSV